MGTDELKGATPLVIGRGLHADGRIAASTGKKKAFTLQDNTKLRVAQRGGKKDWEPEEQDSPELKIRKSGQGGPTPAQISGKFLMGLARLCRLWPEICPKLKNKLCIVTPFGANIFF